MDTETFLLTRQTIRERMNQRRSQPLPAWMSNGSHPSGLWLVTWATFFLATRFGVKPRRWFRRFFAAAVIRSLAQWTRRWGVDRLIPTTFLEQLF